MFAPRNCIALCVAVVDVKVHLCLYMCLSVNAIVECHLTGTKITSGVCVQEVVDRERGRDAVSQL